MDTEHLRRVREDYAQAAKTSTTLCRTDAYRDVDLSFIPEEVLTANQGCSSPFTGSDVGLRRGDRVIDLGCGAGLDVFLAAKSVGAKGQVIGVDMTPEMLEIARRNTVQVQAALGVGAPAIRFEQASIEALPLGDDSVDVALSNCVVNLSERKKDVFAELYRVLRPGGRFLIADVFSPTQLPFYMRHDRNLISQCIGGAIPIGDFLKLVREVGFRGVTLTASRGYQRVDGIDFSSLTVTAYKPVHSELESAYATLVGPCSAVVDEDGRRYQRGVSTPVDRKTAGLLGKAPYRDYFYLSSTADAIDSKACLGIPPEAGPCVYVGEFVTLVGPFREIEDDDGHRFVAGEASEICEKTSRVLLYPLYNRLLLRVNRAQQRPDAERVECGPACC